jgi:hypothetical protein
MFKAESPSQGLKITLTPNNEATVEELFLSNGTGKIASYLCVLNCRYVCILCVCGVQEQALVRTGV